MVYRYKCIVAYDGTNYHGWQKQNNASTVQEEIEGSLFQLHQYPVKTHGASRTDSGVHANYQVFHFDSDKKMDGSRMKLAINHFLPDDIFVKEVIEVGNDFHSRHNVTKKEYVYHLNIGSFDPMTRHFTGLEYRTLDIGVMKEAIKHVIGTHDFASFTSDGEYYHTIRTIYEAEIEQKGDLLTFRFVGNGFLRYMIRILVGTIVEIGANKKVDMVQILNSKDRNQAGVKMEPSGLFLNHIWYD